MHPFREYMSDYAALNDEEWKKVEGCLARKEYQKGEIILNNGDICNRLYFVEDGLLRFFIYRNGESVTKFFTESPYCFTSQKSFTDDIPTEDNIEVLQDSVIWEMSKRDAFELLKIFNWSEFPA